MRLSAAGIKTQQHTALIDIDGEPLRCTFKPYTIADKRALGESMKDSLTGGDEEATEFLSSVLLSWDLPTSDDDPAPYPTDAASLSLLPAEFVGAVLRGINESRQVGKG